MTLNERAGKVAKALGHTHPTAYLYAVSVISLAIREAVAEALAERGQPTGQPATTPAAPRRMMESEG